MAVWNKLTPEIEHTLMLFILEKNGCKIVEMKYPKDINENNKLGPLRKIAMDCQFQFENSASHIKHFPLFLSFILNRIKLRLSYSISIIL